MSYEDNKLKYWGIGTGIVITLVGAAYGVNRAYHAIFDKKSPLEINLSELDPKKKDITSLGLEFEGKVPIGGKDIGVVITDTTGATVETETLPDGRVRTSYFTPEEVKGKKWKLKLDSVSVFTPSDSMNTMFKPGTDLGDTALVYAGKRANKVIASTYKWKTEQQEKAHKEALEKIRKAFSD